MRPLLTDPAAVEHQDAVRVPDGDFVLPIGKAALRRSGDDLAIISYGAYVHVAMRVAERLAADRIDEAAAPRELSLAALGRSPALADARKRLAQLAQAGAPQGRVALLGHQVDLAVPAAPVSRQHAQGLLALGLAAGLRPEPVLPSCAANAKEFGLV